MEIFKMQKSSIAFYNDMIELLKLHLSIVKNLRLLLIMWDVNYVWFWDLKVVKDLADVEIARITL